jgi:hypothetical protein
MRFESCAEETTTAASFRLVLFADVRSSDLPAPHLACALDLRANGLGHHDFERFALEHGCDTRWLNLNGQIFDSKDPLRPLLCVSAFVSSLSFSRRSQ